MSNLFTSVIRWNLRVTAVPRNDDTNPGNSHFKLIAGQNHVIACGWYVLVHLTILSNIIVLTRGKSRTCFNRGRYTERGRGYGSLSQWCLHLCSGWISFSDLFLMSACASDIRQTHWNRPSFLVWIRAQISKWHAIIFGFTNCQPINGATCLQNTTIRPKWERVDRCRNLTFAESWAAVVIEKS